MPTVAAIEEMLTIAAAGGFLEFAVRGAAASERSVEMHAEQVRPVLVRISSDGCGLMVPATLMRASSRPKVRLLMRWRRPRMRCR